MCYHPNQIGNFSPIGAILKWEAEVDSSHNNYCLVSIRYEISILMPILDEGTYQLLS